MKWYRIKSHWGFVELGETRRSYQCPPNSCRNLVILVESGGIKFGRKACYFFSFRCLLFRQNLGILELRPECSAEFTGTECNGIRLFVCLFVYFTPVTKQTTNQTPCDMVSFCHPPPLLPPHQRHPQQWPMTALPPHQCQQTTIKDNHSRLPRNDNKPPKMNTNDGQHTKTAATPKKWTTAHHHHPPQPTNNGQHPQTDTGDADWWRGTRTMMRDKGRRQWQWLSSSSSFYISYCKYPLPLSSLSTNATPPPSTAHLITPPQWEGPPIRQRPCHHAKRNDTRRQWHRWMMHSDRQRQTANNDDQKPMATNDCWQHRWPTSSTQQHHPQTMRSAQHHLHACTNTTTTHQHPPQMAMSNHPWMEPPPRPPSNSTHHEWHHHHQPTARRADHHNQQTVMRACLFLPPRLPFNVHSNNIVYLLLFKYTWILHVHSYKRLSHMTF